MILIMIMIRIIIIIIIIPLSKHIYYKVQCTDTYFLCPARV